jgi:ABC-2 type transport system ATP-binding protein
MTNARNPPDAATPVVPDPVGPTRVVANPVIASDALAKRFGHVDAVSGLTMTVGRGEVFGFLGPNGAGKTTVVKLLLGLTSPTSGRATVLGAPIGNRIARRRIGYLPELFRYQPWLSAREVLILHGRLRGDPASDAEIAAGLDRVGLRARADDRVGTFSKGMQQRLGLAVSLLGDPDLVVLDEPTSALDPSGRADVRDIIRAVRDRGATVFLNSHLLTEVERVADRLAVVADGRVIATGTLDELLGSSAIRIRVTGIPVSDLVELREFGRVELGADDWLTIETEAARDRTPDVVGWLVRRGGRIHAVDDGRRSLEERYLALVGRDGGSSA